RRALGELYLERFLRADRERNTTDMIFYGGLIEQVNDGHFDRVLKGNGSLSITTGSKDSKLVLYRYEERSSVLVPSIEVTRGTGELSIGDLPMGNYLLFLEKETFYPTRYPVCLHRNEEIRANVRLYPLEAIPREFAYVPAG